MNMHRILLVEDDLDSADMLRRRLADKEFDVVHVRTGNEALTRAEADVPDIILMDIRLPDVDGLEVTRRIRQTTAIAHIPIIAITAHALKHHKEEALEAGCDEHHPKPVFFLELLQQIDRLLQERQTSE